MMYKYTPGCFVMARRARKKSGHWRSGSATIGIWAMALLLEEKGDQAKITEDVVKAATGKYNGLTAAASGQTGVLDLISCYNRISRLLTQGADPNLKNIRGESPLWIAAGKGHLEVVRCLIQRPDVNFNSTSISARPPIFWPSAYGYTAIVEELVAAGAVTDIRDTDGETAISIARQCGHLDIDQVLAHSRTRT
ncbi:hypothetical protein CHU98_g11044 [Xylaria longipes]|nr:hypothetical protein CHU98_g11044 [Xylaria longipes]